MKTKQKPTHLKATLTLPQVDLLLRRLNSQKEELDKEVLLTVSLYRLQNICNERSEINALLAQLYTIRKGF